MVQTRNKKARPTLLITDTLTLLLLATLVVAAYTLGRS